jgi:hypothetical protein
MAAAVTFGEQGSVAICHGGVRGRPDGWRGRAVDNRDVVAALAERDLDDVA